MKGKDRFHIGLSVVWWSFLFIAAMYLMLYTANHKTIVIADGAYGQEITGEIIGSGQGLKLAVENTGEANGIFFIPLEEEIKADDVVIENRYMDKELYIHIKGAHEDFYADCAVQGDVSAIRDAYREKKRNGILLRLHMREVNEYRTSMEGNILKVEVCAPHELYKLLVVIDPAGGGGAEGKTDVETYRNQVAAELVLEVGKLLPEQLGSGDIRLYFTRTDDEDVSVEERAALAEAVGADLFLHIDTAADEDTTKYGIRGWYNESYFIPEFGNVEFADIVARNVAVACGNRATGLEAAGEDSVLQSLRIPAAGIDLGYMTNEQESALLFQNNYRVKLAKGIAEAIREVYTNYYE